MRKSVYLILGFVLVFSLALAGCEREPEPLEPVQHKIYIGISPPPSAKKEPVKTAKPAPPKEIKTALKKTAVKKPDPDKELKQKVEAIKKAIKPAEKPKVKPSKTEEPPLEAKKQDTFNTIQVSSFLKLKRALNEKKRLMDELAVPVFVHKIQLNGRWWHRVYVGRFKTKTSAKKMGRLYKDKGLINYFRVVKYREIDKKNPPQS